MPCEPVDLGNGVRAIICGRSSGKTAAGLRELQRRQAEQAAWAHILGPRPPGGKP